MVRPFFTVHFSSDKIITENFFQMQIESIEGFTEVCGRKKKNVKKLTANLNIKKEEENNNLKDEGFATASPTESEESLGKS